MLPDGIQKIKFRSDSASYQADLLNFLNEHDIDFAVSCKVSKRSVAAVKESDWKRLNDYQEWAEVAYVPSWSSSSEDGGAFRFLAIRELFAKDASKGLGEKSRQHMLFDAIEMLELQNDNIKKLQVLVLASGDRGRLAVHRGGIHIGPEMPLDELTIRLEGLDFEEVWRNIVIQIGNIHVFEGNTLDQQIADDARAKKIEAKIASLDRRVRSEKQTLRQQEILAEIRTLKRELETIRNGGTVNDCREYKYIKK